MPGITGWDVAEHVKRRSPHTPVVLVTSWGDRFTPEGVLQRGVDFLVPKLYSLDEIRVLARRARAASPDCARRAALCTVRTRIVRPAAAHGVLPARVHASLSVEYPA